MHAATAPSLLAEQSEESLPQRQCITPFINFDLPLLVNKVCLLHCHGARAVCMREEGHVLAVFDRVLAVFDRGGAHRLVPIPTTLTTSSLYPFYPALIHAPNQDDPSLVLALAS